MLLPEQLSLHVIGRGDATDQVLTPMHLFLQLEPS